MTSRESKQTALSEESTQSHRPVSSSRVPVRALGAVAVSVLLHLGLAGAAVVSPLLSGVMPKTPPIQIEIRAAEAPQDIPLGPAATATKAENASEDTAQDQAAEQEPVDAKLGGTVADADAARRAAEAREKALQRRARARELRRRRRAEQRRRALAARAHGDAGAPALQEQGADGAASGAGVAPEGSRVSALIRLSELRKHPRYLAPTDAVLSLLPDRRQLVEGSDLDIYRDFDALVVATPNPTDAAVTFLAVRHSVTPARLKTQLTAAAAHQGWALDWQDRGGRPVGLRRLQADSVAGTQAPWKKRDDRLFLLAEPTLAVVATQAYADLLLGTNAAEKSPAATRARFKMLGARFAAEEARAPGAVLRLHAANLFSRKKAAALAGKNPVVAPLSGLVPPEALTVVLQLDPAPRIQAELVFGSDQEAADWAQALPALKAQWSNHPGVALIGMDSAVRSIAVSRDDSNHKTVQIEMQPTHDQLLRALGLAASFAK